jgi:hypothetical protein
VAVRADRNQIVDRIHLVFFADVEDLLEVMDVNEVLAQLAPPFLKVEPAQMGRIWGEDARLEAERRI